MLISMFMLVGMLEENSSKAMNAYTYINGLVKFKM